MKHSDIKYNFTLQLNASVKGNINYTRFIREKLMISLTT